MSTETPSTGFQRFLIAVCGFVFFSFILVMAGGMEFYIEKGFHFSLIFSIFMGIFWNYSKEGF